MYQISHNDFTAVFVSSYLYLYQAYLNNFNSFQQRLYVLEMS